MAEQMLQEDFKSSHPNLVGMDLTTDANYQNDGGEEPALKMEAMDPNNNNKDIKRSTLPTRKSVDFAALPPTKRSRPNPEWTLRQALEAVSTTIGKGDRLSVIQKTRETFCHDEQPLHDQELNSGADAVMTKHLAFLMYCAADADSDCLDPASTDQITLELSITLEALESVYRASSECVGQSFKRVGNELLNVLLRTLNRELDRRISSREVMQEETANDENATKGETDGQEGKEEEKEEKTAELADSTPGLKTLSDSDVVTQYFPSPEGDIVIHKATRILGHFARVGDATKPLAHFPGLLGTLLKLITLFPFDRIPWEARLSALWTIANLGCNSENMQMMVCTPGLVDALVQVSCRSLHPGDSVERTIDVLRGRSIASRGLLNLSWAPENKIVLGQQAALVDLLAELSVHRHAPLSKSRTVREILLTTRRHAIGALRNLAAAPRRSKIMLCGYKNGHLLNILTDAALNDIDQHVKDRAFAAINNLAIHDTAEQIVNHPALVMALKDVLLSAEESERDRDNKLSNPQEEGTPRAHASATLLVLERSIEPDSPAYQNLRELLDALNPSQPTDEEESEEESMQVLHATAV
eukprot:CAMPEP_0168735736 /NCGR_PEP_ID=MMETSP0724-20121128/9493_1 /TAXON_ID=265536 /ORGANISM="Amphiprora sp., Strain CCMP467" /LENGTH=586 /DNA_ID=CAMNT_0008782901 /DNA_START=130 /DNA_END=1890 /DNA_ORIENTATION=-